MQPFQPCADCAPDKLKVVEGEGAGAEFTGDAAHEPRVGEPFVFDTDGGPIETPPVEHVFEKGDKFIFKTNERVYALEPNEEYEE